MLKCARTLRSVVDNAVPSVKSALKYTFNHDRRNDAAAPTNGHQLRFSTELAGLGGDVEHVKLEGGAQKFVPITNNLVKLRLRA